MKRLLKNKKKSLKIFLNRRGSTTIMMSEFMKSRFLGSILSISLSHILCIGAYTVKLDVQSQIFLDAVNSVDRPPLESLPLAVIRAGKSPYGYISTAPIAKIEDITIPGTVGEIPVRIYTPYGEGPFSVFVTFHGGGWALGTLDGHDGFCREICSQARCIVVSVDYHRAPEYKFPVPLDDCYTATKWTIQTIAAYGGNPDKIAIGGDSAGGNLAAAVALMARDKHAFSLTAQVLLYPATNYDFTTESYHNYQKGYMLTTAQVKWFWSLYLRSEDDAHNPYACPLRAESAHGLPQTLVVTAACDPLRDDGLLYATKLANAGVSVQQLTYPTIHGFLSFADRIDTGKKATTDIADYLRTVFEQ